MMSSSVSRDQLLPIDDITMAAVTNISRVEAPTRRLGSGAMRIGNSLQAFQAVASANIRRSSGTHEPQFVPALSRRPIASAEASFSRTTASTIWLRPTPKQAQTIGPQSAASPGILAARSARRVVA